MGAVLAFVARAGRPAVLVFAVALVLFVGAYVAYLVRHIGFVREISRADEALRAGELERARAILAPLLESYGHIALVQRAAGRALYELGDPLSAASLLERAARSFHDDASVAAMLVASYAALDRGGDARRAAGIAPKEVDVRLALAWSELVALGGDRLAGTEIVRELRDRADVRSIPARRVMVAALAAIAAAHRVGTWAGGADDAGATRASTGEADLALREVASGRDALSHYERAFIGYLEGVALRELGRVADATAAFERAMEVAPGTIGEALARRERANLLARLAATGPPPTSE